MASRIRIRRGTSAQWAQSTKILEVAELGLDTTLNKLKSGNGVSVWNNLPFLHVTPLELTGQASSTLSSANSYTDTAVAALGNSSAALYVPVTDVGNADGVASLGPDGKIPDSEIPTGIARDTEVAVSISNLVNSAPETLNTLNELATALGNDVNFSTTVTTSLGLKAPIASPTFTGTVSGVTKAMVGLGSVDNTSDVNKPISTATQTALNLKANDAAVTTALATKLNTTTAVSDYLAISAASSTYLSQANATSLYLQKTQPALDYQIFNSGTGFYVVNGVLNGPITLIPGKPARISVQASGHPFWFQTSYGAYNSANVYETGIEGSGTDTGQIVILLPSNAPQLYYACEFHSTMKGVVLFGSDSDLVSFTAKTGSYTPVLKDMGKIIEMGGGGTLTITDSETYPVGTSFEILQTSSSQVTIAGDGFTINATPGLKLRAQWSAATVLKRGLNSWVAFGDLSS